MSLKTFSFSAQNPKERSQMWINHIPFDLRGKYNKFINICGKVWSKNRISEAINHTNNW